MKQVPERIERQDTDGCDPVPPTIPMQIVQRELAVLDCDPVHAATFFPTLAVKTAMSCPLQQS